MDLLRRPGGGPRGIEAVDMEELPAARIEQGQDDVSRILIGHRVEVVARLDGDPQDRRSLADGCGSGGRGDASLPARGGRGLLLAAAAEAKEQGQAEA
jgi:hypothetical protein